MVQALLLVATLSQQADTATFRSAAASRLHTLARTRHVQQDTLVRDYQARVRTRMEASVGKSRFARQTTLIAYETVAEVGWQAPNDLQVNLLGTRARFPLVRMLGGFADREIVDEIRRDLVLDHPWFIPRAFSDSIRLMGVPDHAALHPLAPDAERYYRFAVTDSIEIRVPGRRVQAVAMSVEPKAFGPALIAGTMWVDAETGDVVRMRMLFLGDYLWDKPDGDSPADSASARKGSREAARFLSVEAEVEYALINQMYWMPYRQVLGITAEVPYLMNLTVPARAVTEFSEYDVNRDAPLAFGIPSEDLKEQGRGSVRRVKGDTISDTRVRRDTITIRTRREAREQTESREAQHGYYRSGRWSDGRWEINVPPVDSLLTYEWDTPLVAEIDAVEEERMREIFGDLAKLEDRLPSDWTGKRRWGVAWGEQAAEMIRFDRVQGFSLGVGYMVRPRIPYVSLIAATRFGFADKRLTGSLIARRDGPYARVDISGYRSLTQVEPWTKGQTLGNTLNAAFTGHDDADYYLATGGRLAVTWNDLWRQDMTLFAAVERHGSMAQMAFKHIWGSGSLTANPPVAQGTFFRYGITRNDPIGPASLRTGVELVTDLSLTGGRGWLELQVPFVAVERVGRLSVRTAAVRGDALPQIAPRLGGPQTVRGYDYGTRVARQMWSAQLDIGLTRTGWWSPVVFADIGDTYTGDPMIGVGGGVSLLNGLLRFNLSKGVRPDTEVRFDLLFRAPR